MQTNGLSYFLRGINAVEPKFQYEKLPRQDKNQFVLINASHKFDGSFSNPYLDQNGRKSVIVDEAIRVSCVADHVRTDAQKEWKALAGKSRTTFVSTIITGTITTLAGLTAGVAALVLPPLILVAIPVSIIGIAILIVAGRSYSNKNTAEKELDKWKDPVLVAMEHRQKAGIQGFFYARDKALKERSILHPDEIKSLWYRLKLNHQKINADAGSINGYFNNNPLNRNVIEYAFDYDVPQDVEVLCQSFSLIETRYKALKAENSARKENINSQKHDVIARIEARRAALLTRLVSRRNNFVSRRRHPRDISRNNVVFGLLKGPINAHCDAQKRNVEQWAQQAINQIQASEDGALRHFYQPIVALQERYQYLQQEVHNDGYDAIYPEVQGILNNIPVVKPSAPRYEDLDIPPYEACEEQGISRQEYNEYLA